MIIARKEIEKFAAFVAKIFLPMDGCAILMFHHVAEPDINSLRINEHLKVSPDYLQSIIRDLKRRGYAFLSMDEVAENMRLSRKMPKTVSLTFDDGYLDNFAVGRQILSAEEVPGIVYVATGLGTSVAPIWWDVIAEYVLHAEKCVLPSGDSVRCKTFVEKERAFISLRNWTLSLPPENIRGEFAKLFQKSLEWIDSFGSQMANRDVISRFASDRFLSIGCHTHGHIPCGRLPYQTVEADFRKSLEYLYSCGVDVKHFAFPYGEEENDAERFVDMFTSANIESAVTTYSGVLKVGNDSRFFMPRIFVSQCDGFSERNIHLGLFQNYVRRLRVGRRFLG